MNSIEKILLQKFESSRIICWRDTKCELHDDFEALNLPEVEKIEVSFLKINFLKIKDLINSDFNRLIDSDEKLLLSLFFNKNLSKAIVEYIETLRNSGLKNFIDKRYSEFIENDKLVSR